MGTLENPALNQLISQIRQEVLPAEIEAIPRQELLAASQKGANSGIDLILEFRLSRGRQRVLAAIQYKERLLPSMMDGIFYRATRIKRSIESQLLNSGLPIVVMIATQHLTESVQKRCREEGLSYIDEKGNLFLSADGIYIDIIRPIQKGHGIKREVGNIFTGKSRRILRVLLANPGVPFRLEDLAKTAGVSVAQAFQVTNRLQEQSLLNRSTSGRMLSHPGKVLRALAQEMQGDYARKRTVYPAFSDLPQKKLLERLANYCESQEIGYAFTLFSGLEPHESNLIESLSALYISIDPEKLARDLDLAYAAKGANLLIMQAPPSDNTEQGGVFYEPRRLENGVMAVNPIQAYLDFALYPARGREQAEFIARKVLGFRE